MAASTQTTPNQVGRASLDAEKAGVIQDEPPQLKSDAMQDVRAALIQAAWGKKHG